MEMIKYTDEKDFTINIVMPWLDRKGFRDIQYTHGIDEHGKDIVFKDKQRNKLNAVLVRPKIHGGLNKKGNIQQVIDEAKDAFDNPFDDISSKKRIKISKLYIISAKEITRNAKETIVNKVGIEKDIIFIEVNKIYNELKKSDPRIKDISISLILEPKHNLVINSFKKKIKYLFEEINYNKEIIFEDKCEKDNFYLIAKSNYKSGLLGVLRINIYKIPPKLCSKVFKLVSVTLDKAIKNYGMNDKVMICLNFNKIDTVKKLEEFRVRFFSKINSSTIEDLEQNHIKVIGGKTLFEKKLLNKVIIKWQ